MILDFRFQSGGADLESVLRGVGGVEPHNDFLGVGGGDGEAAIVGGQRQPAAAAINEDGEFDFFGTPVIEEFGEGGLHGAAGEEHIINKYDRGAIDVVRNDGRSEFLRDRVPADVVPMKRNIDRAEGGDDAGFF